MRCRPHCAACCIAPSISSAIPATPGRSGMPFGKAAGVRCVQLDDQDRCRLFGHPQRPQVCSSLGPSTQMCGTNREQAMLWLGRLEVATHSGMRA